MFAFNCIFLREKQTSPQKTRFLTATLFVNDFLVNIYIIQKR